MVRIIVELVKFILELARSGRTSSNLTDKVSVDDLVATIMALNNVKDEELVVDSTGLIWKVSDYNGKFLSLFSPLFTPRKVSLTQDASKDLIVHEGCKVGNVLSPTAVEVQMKLIRAASRNTFPSDTVNVSDKIKPTTVQDMSCNWHVDNKMANYKGLPICVKLSDVFEDWEGFDYNSDLILTKMKADILK